jgi:hypothetical protein
MDETQSPSAGPLASGPATATPAAAGVFPEAATLTASNPSFPVSKVTWVSTFTLAPAALGLLTAMFLLTGRAYWLGYLGYFHLESTMFSDDLSNQVTRSVAAWLYAIQQVSVWIRAHIQWTTLIAFLLPIAVFLTLCVVAAIGRVIGGLGGRIVRWAAEQTRGVRSHPISRQAILNAARWFAPPSFARTFMRGFALAYASAYFLYIAFWAVGLVIVLLVGPFDTVGRSVAAKDMEEHFGSSPVVTVSDSSGRPSEYRMILCAPRYCALFDGKRAITVASSSVARTDSPAPGSSHSP